MTDAMATTNGARRRRLVSPPVIGVAVALVLLGLAAGVWFLFRDGGPLASGPAPSADVQSAQEAYEAGDFAAAEAALAGLVGDSAEGLEARRALALALAAQGKNDEALEQYAAIIAAEPEDDVSLFQMAVLERLLGRTPSAIEHFEAALEVKTDPTYADELARTYMQAGRYDDAIEKWQMVLDAGGLDEAGQAAVYAAMADAHEGARRYDQARAALERALFLLPNDEALRTRLEAYED